ncbi:hypothetical protein EV11_0157 [Prochlorococcus sp. SS52]|nr:hypothetical protein EV11_0157 [Prochlorococcus sp. SS52]
MKTKNQPKSILAIFKGLFKIITAISIAIPEGKSLKIATNSGPDD